MNNPEVWPHVFQNKACWPKCPACCPQSSNDQMSILHMQSTLGTQNSANTCVLKGMKKEAEELLESKARERSGTPPLQVFLSLSLSLLLQLDNERANKKTDWTPLCSTFQLLLYWTQMFAHLQHQRCHAHDTRNELRCLHGLRAGARHLHDSVALFRRTNTTHRLAVTLELKQNMLILIPRLPRRSIPYWWNVTFLTTIYRTSTLICPLIHLYPPQPSKSM